MKENLDRLYVHPEFKRLVQIEAASKGKSVLQYTHDVVTQKNPLDEIAADWNKKWKRPEKPRGFDFL